MQQQQQHLQQQTAQQLLGMGRGLERATVPPPLKPELSSPTDTAHFDEALQDDKFFGEAAYMPEAGAWDASF